ncbi:MAG: hypothetical protein IID45_08930 [Planctomycetes bacterium]|nr:hypothetical protein [Planctomycetota bacterium]
MPEILETQCPHCSATIKLKSRKALGKQVTCPQCNDSFRVQEKKPAGDRDDFSAEDNLDDIEEFSDDEVIGSASGDRELGVDDDGSAHGVSPSAGLKSGSKKRRKKKSTGWRKPAFIAGGSVLGLAAIGLVLWLVFRSSPQAIDLSYLPEDTRKITVTRYADLWNSHMIQEIRPHSKLDEKVAKMKREWGLEPKDIDSVTTATVKNYERLTVVRTNVDMDGLKIANQLGHLGDSTYNGKAFYHLARKQAVYFPNSRTALSGPEDVVKDAIDRGSEAKKRKELDFLDPDFHVVTVDLAKEDRYLIGAGKKWLQKSDRKSFGADIDRVAVSHSLGKSEKNTYRYHFFAADQAESFAELARQGSKKKLEVWQEKGRQEMKINMQKQQSRGRTRQPLTEEDIDSLLDVVEANLKSVTVERDGSVVIVTEELRLSVTLKKKFGAPSLADEIVSLLENTKWIFGGARLDRRFRSSIFR